MANVRTQGLIFPLELTDGKHSLFEGDSLIQSSIKMILEWPIYLREYVDEFGSRLHEALEHPNDDVLKTLIEKFIVDSLVTWEPRISLQALKFERPTPESLVVDITYLITDEQIEGNLTYVFYSN